ncbi:HDOD domain-containing protein [Chitinimonas arctica]|nr:HDOD domain-containing protein [Chitinimonas arctica]
MAEETIYTLVAEAGRTWLAQAEDGHWALLVPDPGLIATQLACDGGHAVLAPLEGDAEIDGTRWLAYRWGEGESLAERLAGGSMAKMEAVRLGLKLLDGAVHGRLVGHPLGPVSAERVLLDSDDMPRLAAILPRGEAGDDALRGMGALLFHMLTGSPPLRDPRGALPSLPGLVPDLDPRLESIVLGALGEPAAPKYEHLLELRAALIDYLAELEALDGPGEEDDSLGAQLLRRMEKTEDFPALSRAIGALNRITDGDTEKLQALATVILRDFSLTNKVLRLANSATYGQFGGSISTISRAVMVLGFGTVKSMAMSLVLIEHLTDHEQAGELKDEAARAFFASLVARQLAEKSGYRDLEEARVSGMFHLLGRLLTLFFFHREAQEINRLVDGGEPEDSAARRQLGVSYEELGMSVGQAWNLPGKLISSMAAETGKPRPPRHDGDWLRLFANAGNLLTRATLADGEPARFKGFLQVRDQFGEALRLSERELRVSVDDAARETLREAAIFGLEAQASGVLARLRSLAGLPTLAQQGGEAAAAAGLSSRTPAETAAQTATDPLAKTAGAAFVALETFDRPEVVDALASCVQDVTETLLDDFRLNDLLRMILETIYRSLGVNRALIATRSVQRNAIIGRFGFGEDIDAFLPRFALPLDDTADVFRVSLSNNVDVLIEDVDSLAIRDRIPHWFRQIGAGSTFLLMPIVIDKKIVGLFYADKAAGSSLRLGRKELSLCKTLRNQAILAIRQKTPPTAGT